MNTSDGTNQRGPWPENDVAEPSANADQLTRETAAVASDIDATIERATDHIDDIDDHVAAWNARTEASGSKGISLAVSGLSVAYMMALPALLVVGIYTYITIYAIVKAIDAGPDTADAGVIVVGVVGMTTFFVVLIGVGLWAIGRAADPRKRPR